MLSGIPLVHPAGRPGNEANFCACKLVLLASSPPFLPSLPSLPPLTSFPPSPHLPPSLPSPPSLPPLISIPPSPHLLPSLPSPPSFPPPRAFLPLPPSLAPGPSLVLSLYTAYIMSKDCNFVKQHFQCNCLLMIFTAAVSVHTVIIHDT